MVHLFKYLIDYREEEYGIHEHLHRVPSGDQRRRKHNGFDEKTHQTY